MSQDRQDSQRRPAAAASGQAAGSAANSGSTGGVGKQTLTGSLGSGAVVQRKGGTDASTASTDASVASATDKDGDGWDDRYKTKKTTTGLTMDKYEALIGVKGSGLGSVAEMRAWQEQIAGSELVVLPGNSYHVAATHADPSARATLDFIARRGGG